VLTVIYRQEVTQMSPQVEAKLWRQLRGAFGINQLIEVPGDFATVEEALENSPGARVFLEPKGVHSLAAMPPDGDLVLIVGNTAENNLSLARPSETYYIATNGTENHNHLYGVNAAAIALAIRYGQ
jgi:hypothetical protein